jgi:hypothetical protein
VRIVAPHYRFKWVPTLPSPHISPAHSCDPVGARVGGQPIPNTRIARGGIRQIMHRNPARIDGSIIPNGERIDPIVINVAIEELCPTTILREAQLITKKWIVIEARHDDDIESPTLAPIRPREKSWNGPRPIPPGSRITSPSGR